MVEGLKSVDEMYRRGKKEGVVIDVGYVNILFYVVMELGDYVYVMKIFDDMVVGVELLLDVLLLVYVLLVCVKAKEVDVAMEYFERGLKVGIDYDIFIIDVLLKLCVKFGCVVDVLEVFMDVMVYGIKVREFIIIFLFSAY